MIKPSILSLSILTLSGCATVDLRDALSTTQSQIKSVHTGDWTYIQSDEQKTAMQKRSQALLNQSLTQSQAVELMLTHSLQFQALLANHWKTINQSAQYGRIANPTLGLERMTTAHELEIGRILSFGILDLLSLPTRQKSAEFSISKAQLQLSSQVLAQINAVQIAWVEAVESQEKLALAKQVSTSLEATADLAERMQKSGNFNRLQSLRQQMLHSNSLVNLASAQQRAIATREKLVRLLGLTANESLQLKLPKQLPELPKQPISANKVRHLAPNRLDVQIAQLNYQFLLEKHGYSQVASLVDIEGTLMNNSVSNKETGESERPRGYEIELRVPLFDWGDFKRTALKAELKAASDSLEHTLRSASSYVRESYAQYRTAYDIAQHFKNDVLPMQELIAEENTYRYNGMFIGVFEWIAERKNQTSVYENAIQSKANYWKSHIDLNANMLGQPSNLNLEPMAANNMTESGGH